jgi:GGDEF domain-containing protein
MRSTNRQIQDRLEKGDVFAPFNDNYGFSRGDEVIRMTGRLILNIVRNRQPKNSFVGHIGGDDFVFIVEVALAEQICDEIVNAFDRIIPTIYEAEDRYKGYIQAPDRHGDMRTFPIMSISIGITDTRIIPAEHYGEITEAASEMKKYAKQYKGSCYRYDRRRSRLIPS